MHTKRIIPCLDVHGGRVVKGVNFVDLKDAGDPVEIGKLTTRQGQMNWYFLTLPRLQTEELLWWIWCAKWQKQYLSPLP